MAGVGPPGREPWVVFAPTGRAVGDHVFWPFHGRSELTAVAQAFVVEGLARRERVLYVGPGRPRDLRHDLVGVPDLEDCLDRGQLLVVEQPPGRPEGRDPVDELIDLAVMTRDSLDAGYTGLRMVGDGTMRVVDPTRRDRFVRYEHLVDRFCLDHRFTGLCALDATAVGEGLLAELGCVHKLTHGELSPFALRAAAGADAALVGSVDAFSVAQLVAALGRIGVPRPGGQMVLDAVGLELVDVRALRELDRYAADRGATVLLRSPSFLVLRLLQLLEPRAVRLEPSP